MARKKINRGGVIPYRIDEGVIKMMFMVPSEKKFGGEEPQLAKGKQEEGEDDETTAFREAKEELGLFKPNCTNIQKLGTFMGRTTVFIAEVKDVDMFGEPHFETKEVMWLTPDEFKEQGRDLHKPVVKAAVRLIESSDANLERLCPKKDLKEAFPDHNIIEEMKFTGDIKVHHNGNRTRASFDIDGQPYVVDLTVRTIEPFNITGLDISFGPLDGDGSVGNTLTDFDHSPKKVIAAVQKVRRTILNDMLSEYEVDFVMYVAKDNIQSRLRLYARIEGALALVTQQNQQHFSVKGCEVVVTFLSKKAISQANDIKQWVADIV